MYLELNLCCRAGNGKMCQSWKQFQISTSCQHDATRFEITEFWRVCSPVLLFHHQLDCRARLQHKAAGTSQAPTSALVAAVPVPGTWDDPDPDMLIDLPAFAGTCLVAVDFCGDWDCWLTLVTTSAALGWVPWGSLAVPLGPRLTLPCGKLPLLPLAPCSRVRMESGGLAGGGWEARRQVCKKPRAWSWKGLGLAQIHSTGTTKKALAHLSG